MRFIPMTLALALAAASPPLTAADYPIVYVRGPRSTTVAPSMPEVSRPAVIDSGVDLMRIDPGGAQTVLYDCDASCSVTDPSISLDGRRVYFSVLYNPSSLYRGWTPFGGCSIYSMPVGGGAVTPVVLAADGYDSLPVGLNPPYAPCNLAPQELPGERLAFTSNRWGQEPPKSVFSAPSFQIFVRQATGEIEPIAPMTVGSALHPILLTSGELVFSSLENQGWRDSRNWGLWSIYPDGRQWKPLVSASADFSAFHFQTQRSNGDIVVIDYYNANNWGAGSALSVPWPRPVPAFHSAFDQPCLPRTTSSGVGCFSFGFVPQGFAVLTPWTHPDDRPAPCPGGASSCSADQRLGKVIHPAAYPGDRLLYTWSGGPVTKNVQPTTPLPDFGIYLAPRGGATTQPGDLELVVNDPIHHEYLPRVVAPYATIYGRQPAELPWLPQTSPYIEPGSPYGIVGTSSVFHRESFPGKGSAAFGGLDPFNTSENLVAANWVTQGSDTSLYSDSEIAAVRIVLLEPLLAGESAALPFRHFASERHRVLGEVPVAADGSWWARVPADTPFTFQLISHRGESLTMAQTWHQVRPGEVRTDCGGCHAHSQQPIPFEGTIASQQPPTILGGPPKNITWLNRIADLIVGRVAGALRGVALGALGPDAAYDCLADDRGGDCHASALSSGDWRQTNLSAFVSGYRSRRSLLWWEAFGARRDGHTNADHPATGNGGDLDYLDEINWSPALTEQERRDLAAWIDLGAPYGGPAWDRDTARPVVHVEEPRPGEYEEVPRLLYGAADAYSGLASVTVTASWPVAGRAPGENLHDLAELVGDGTWELHLDGGECAADLCAQELVVAALDEDGNRRTVQRKFKRKKKTQMPTPAPIPATPTPAPPGTTPAPIPATPTPAPPGTTPEPIPATPTPVPPGTAPEPEPTASPETPFRPTEATKQVSPVP